MIPRQSHDCKTTFVNGINPFLAACPEPCEPRPVESLAFVTTRAQIIQLLVNLGPKTATQISEHIGLVPPTVRHKCLRMARTGLIKVTPQKGKCGKPENVYSVWEHQL